MEEWNVEKLKTLFYSLYKEDTIQLIKSHEPRDKRKTSKWLLLLLLSGIGDNSIILGELSKHATPKDANEVHRYLKNRIHLDTDDIAWGVYCLGSVQPRRYVKFFVHTLRNTKNQVIIDFCLEAIGNSMSPQGLYDVIRFIDDPREKVRYSARWALETIASRYKIY